MKLEFLFIYSLTVFIASITPGPSMLLALNHGVKYGAKRSVATAMGNVTATLIQALLSIAGLSAILLSSEYIFYTIKYLGAAYLIYIGVKTFFSKDIILTSTQTSGDAKRLRQLFTQAFVVTIGNPKAVVFFTALFPQFIKPQQNTMLQFVFILSILLVIAFSCMMIYSYFGQKVTAFFSKAKVRRRFNKVVGGSFIGMGIGLAVEK